MVRTKSFEIRIFHRRTRMQRHLAFTPSQDGLWCPMAKLVMTVLRPMQRYLGPIAKVGLTGETQSSPIPFHILQRNTSEAVAYKTFCCA